MEMDDAKRPAIFAHRVRLFNLELYSSMARLRVAAATESDADGAVRQVLV